LWHSLAPAEVDARDGARGSELQEMVIVVGLRSGGLALIAGTVLLLWGLRSAQK